ncbi:acyl-CoA thioesterase [Actinoallomurus iriomotensis]|uniref:Thioesterase n=1 Tax=Actinoallomurus iriomotensis TaxID=478107 RepID=A0A9W6RM42_9ACTN|nr:acyl-CoA thioesterase [Actinoallomurus iriomotensis]GLY77565.1 thioesterase [Actinoallomurus iriomotensis]
MSSDPFSVRLDVRLYDLDAQLHVNGAVYHQYADHARFACVQAAGVSVDELIADGMGPVNLETVIHYRAELRGGDTVDVSCAWAWRPGRTYEVRHVLRRIDGTVAAELKHVSGLLDLRTRRLVRDPAAEWRRRAVRPELLGLAVPSDGYSV